MKKRNKMALVIIIGGVVLIAIGTLVFWYGQSMKNSEELSVIRKESERKTNL